MNYPVNDQTLTMTSREIAEVTDKQHQHVKRDIEKMFAELNEDVSKFGRIYSDSMNRNQTEYVLDKEHTECLVTGYSAMLRMKVIKRMHELEEKTRVPQTLPEALRLAADLAEQKAELESKLAIAAPKADFVDHYVEATGLMGFREVAKLLKVKENDFRVFLMDNNIMYKLAGKMTPYSQHLDAGRFQVKTGEADNGHAFSQAKFTPKGVEWLAGLLARENIKAA
ncbi:phage antirepressor KilAC domain-containing protein [Tatumella sp. OPLPL6]|uniref:phage antirepressor KilAC domain-containing protein n=1 Tax=Tatumella sp. OPLPL6 TaxID=1928657 RepID=UPI000C18C2E5|nr:phage antirepressor KilAC domain-containing protein [Tatumella sp. OPLPL6]PIJ46069.1 phage regulatory protein/antirepressor Ant [Tatumella sp. OPLPL6]